MTGEAEGHDGSVKDKRVAPQGGRREESAEHAARDGAGAAGTAGGATRADTQGGGV